MESRNMHSFFHLGPFTQLDDLAMSPRCVNGSRVHALLSLSPMNLHLCIIRLLGCPQFLATTNRAALSTFTEVLPVGVGFYISWEVPGKGMARSSGGWVFKS